MITVALVTEMSFDIAGGLLVTGKERNIHVFHVNYICHVCEPRMVNWFIRFDIVTLTH